MSDKSSSKGSKAKPKGGKSKKAKGPCPYECQQVPLNVPSPDAATKCLHPQKDVFVVKVSKVNPTGDRRIKMELELVTPRAKDRRAPWRLDSRETQYDRPCSPCAAPCNTCCPRLRCKNSKKKSMNPPG